jgi:membrane-bound lytic murein transglycosylase MltF
MSKHALITVKAIFITFLMLLSLQQGIAAQTPPGDEADKMGNEINLYLQQRKVDPVKTGKRALRVLVTYNATNYFIVEGKQAGLEYDLMHNFERFLNKGLPADRKSHLIFIARPFEQLIPSLLNGEGDIIAAGMTITPERSTKVAFTNPYRTNISEVVVRNRKAAIVEDAFGLAGKTINVISGSSYVTSLKHLNQELKKNKKASVKIAQADKHLVSEDLLQMVNAGIYDYTVVDSHIAEIWSHVLEDIVVETGASVSTGSQLAWAVRKDNTELKNKLNIFLKTHKQGTETGNVLFNRYYKKTKWISNPVNDNTLKRLHEYQKAFMKYGE